jgi:(2Fe-2S) ferredoxin
MVVFPGPTYYQAINQERLVRIVAEHFIGGKPVAEYFWTGVRHRIIPPGGKAELRPLPIPVRRDGDTESKGHDTDRSRVKRPPREVDDFKW